MRREDEISLSRGFFNESQIVFQRLEVYGVYLPPEDRFFPWFSVFDFESILAKIENDATHKLEWTHYHVPVSVSVCSNVPGYERPACFVNPDLDELLKAMVATLTEIQETCAGMARSKWGPYMDSLKESLRSLDEGKEEERQESERVKTLMGQLRYT